APVPFALPPAPASASPLPVLATAQHASTSNPALADFNLPTHFPSPGIAPGTGRLYIWRETMRLIAKRPLTGYGMDTLVYAFPQNHLEKVAGLGDYSFYVTKPHNAFISYAYGAGIPALLSFMLLNIFAAVAFLRWFFALRKAREKPDLLIMCAFLGWAAYLVQAFVNDDLISTAPLWWTLFGVGAGLLAAAAPITHARSTHPATHPATQPATHPATRSNVYSSPTDA
ncbi:MAG: O-antigen ligase family protein, partial [Oscillospiraceae bacterium]|nr:O-antigen ligase family protein [Oscillospiraceae bacterium]